MNLRNIDRYFILVAILIFLILISSVFFNSIKTKETHKDISSYLKETEYIIKDINNLNNIFKKSQQYEVTYLMEIKNKLEKDLINVYKINPPDILKQYHLMIIKKLNLAYEISLYSINNKEKKKSSQIKILISKLNLYEEIRKAELINSFKKINMEYSFSPNGDIIYRWSK
ncbi:MAG: hypothetical protein FH753_01625 [Firmicutes bacterium]|nr:hypothetical protein [Bacillota bacterium]